MYTDTFLQRFFSALEIHEGVNNDHWASLIKSIKINQSILQVEYDALEKALKHELSRLPESDLVSLYKETEEGLTLDEDNKESYSVDFIQMVLVEELMDRITSIAWEQANRSQ
jgi:hypothetical protein